MLASDILTYRDFLKDSAEPASLRLAMIKRYKEIKSISQVAREFNTTRVTVRKWIKRFSESVVGSLKNLSRAPFETFQADGSRNRRVAG